ncbi:tyrosine-type recombinase/integrase [Qipengyuania aquimaris]|uniref:Tyrosine-type recombinase/integrase n=1 Tax=Qipengyuania aquimaris TaxID=255984 RepID=A0A9Q3S2H9_9SPHN|nr:tyrosine-type recombinase/integrase [Qipengyuania aquimaris]
MALSVTGIRSLQSRERQYKKADEKGLYLLVRPNGSKLWQHKIRVAGKEKVLSYGAFPDTSLAEARRKRDESRAMLMAGVDPALERKRVKAKAKVSAQDSFARVAEEYIRKRKLDGLAPATIAKAEWFLSLLKPAIGSVPVGEVEPQVLLAALKRLESKGNYETAKKTLSFASRVFRYAVATARANSDPAGLLRGALISPKPEHFSAILDPTKFGTLLQAIDGYSGQPVTRLALQIAPHVFLRPGELRKATWDEIDLENATWTIPAGRMKSRRQHVLPLSRQVLELFAELAAYTGNRGYAFPAFHTTQRPLSENTLNQALRRLGFSKETMTAHGFRATASTMLNESGRWSPDAIERSLAHADRDAVRAAYNRGQHWEERVEMAQRWSDKLEQLKSRSSV